MNCGDGLSEEKHRSRVCDVSSRKLHTICQFVRRNTLQEKLTAISVFSFVALERNSKKPNSDCSSQTENNRRKHPPSDANGLVLVVLHTQIIFGKTSQLLLSGDVAD